jgi:hypothetical protein
VVSVITKGFGETGAFDKIKDAADMGFDAISEALRFDFYLIPAFLNASVAI